MGDSLQVYQGISAYASRLDNIAEFYGMLNLPQLPGLPKPEPVILTAVLKHYFESIGGSTVKITYEDTEIKATGKNSQSYVCHQVSLQIS